MADKLNEFAAGEQGFVAKLNKVVGVVNAQAKQIEDLCKALDGKADKRKATSK